MLGLQSSALPSWRRGRCSSGGSRTPDILVNSQTLYQLSYARMIKADGRHRTCNISLTGRALYQLSYASTEFGEKESNPQHIAPEAIVLPVELSPIEKFGCRDSNSDRRNQNPPAYR